MTIDVHVGVGEFNLAEQLPRAAQEMARRLADVPEYHVFEYREGGRKVVLSRTVYPQSKHNTKADSTLYFNLQLGLGDNGDNWLSEVRLIFSEDGQMLEGTPYMRPIYGQRVVGRYGLTDEARQGVREEFNRVVYCTNWECLVSSLPNPSDKSSKEEMEAQMRRMEDSDFCKKAMVEYNPNRGISIITRRHWILHPTDVRETSEVVDSAGETRLATLINSWREGTAEVCVYQVGADVALQYDDRLQCGIQVLNPAGTGKESLQFKVLYHHL